MERNELLSSKEYWLSKIQIQLFAVVEDYIKDNKLNRSKFAEEMGVTKGYVSQVLNGDYDSRISKLVELSLAVGKVPFIEFKGLRQVIELDNSRINGAVFTNTPYIVAEIYGTVDDEVVDVEYVLSDQSTSRTQIHSAHYNTELKR